MTQQDRMMMHCFGIYGGGVLVGSLLGVGRAVEREVLPVLRHPRFLPSVFLYNSLIVFVIMRCVRVSVSL